MTKRSRQDWIDQAKAVLLTAGPEAVSVEEIARRLGVTKGGFYGYFAGRAELLTALLDEWETRSTVEVEQAAERQVAEPGRRAFLASRLTWDGELGELDTAVRSWARRDPEVAHRLSRVDAFRVAYLRRLLAEISADDREADLRTALAYSAAIGMRFAAPDAGLPGRGREDLIAVVTTPGALRIDWPGSPA